MNCAQAALEEMNKFGKGPNDVLWVGQARIMPDNPESPRALGTWEEFVNSHYGKSSEEVSGCWDETLIVKGNGWWLELIATEYDRKYYKYWEYRVEPVKPTITYSLLWLNDKESAK